MGLFPEFVWTLVFDLRLFLGKIRPLVKFSVCVLHLDPASACGKCILYYSSGTGSFFHFI